MNNEQEQIADIKNSDLYKDLIVRRPGDPRLTRMKIKIAGLLARMQDPEPVPVAEDPVAPVTVFGIPLLDMPAPVNPLDIKATQQKPATRENKNRRR